MIKNEVKRGRRRGWFGILKGTLLGFILGILVGL